VHRLELGDALLRREALTLQLDLGVDLVRSRATFASAAAEVLFFSLRSSRKARSEITV